MNFTPPKQDSEKSRVEEEKELMTLHYHVWKLDLLISRAKLSKQSSIMLLLIIDNIQYKRNYLLRLAERSKKKENIIAIKNSINEKVTESVIAFFHSQGITNWKITHNSIQAPEIHKISKELQSTYNNMEFYNSSTRALDLTKIVNQELRAQGMPFVLDKNSINYDERLTFLAHYRYFKKSYPPNICKNNDNIPIESKGLNMYEYDESLQKLVQSN